ncbi:MAG: chromosome segregation protein SMC [Pseudomonadota bacterium]
MHITQLRIAGFKSFVDPTDIPIEPGLTGIVGPNGCGKSNLLEALRWTMGASSARAMRGGEMDDLIFSGSADRPARETAEVTLVLDNSDRKAPPDFNGSDTLEVLRRLKRAAGSTYKINGRTVRGKDIQLLFADASTGANSPSLVRQGQISELIASKPQNRRRILEEAAGIAGLNTRRHEAELKLNGAETNLERLTEVSSEVERQLESLKRQARKAGKYKVLSEEIAALEAYAAHLKWQAAAAQCDEARAALKRAQEDVERLSREDARLETERLKAGEALAPLRDAEAFQSGKLGQARVALARLEAERDSAAKAVMRLEGELSRLAGDLEREQQLKEEAGAAAARTRDELSALPQDDPGVDAAQETAAREALAAAQAELAHAETAVDEAGRALAEYKARREAAEANTAAQTRRRDQLKTEADRLTRELRALGEAGDLSAKVQSAEADLAKAEAALADAEAAVEAAEAKLAAAKSQEEAAEAPQAAAAGEVRSLEAEIAGLERLLRKSDAATAPPIVERVRTRDGYEKAVAAALGDDLQASTDRSAAMHWAGAKESRSELPAGATPLSEVTDAPGELAARLAHCGLVDAADGARLAATLQPGQRLVSTEGHLWRWDGYVRTPEAPAPAAERLESQARLQAARGALEPVRAALVDADGALAAARQARETAAAELKTAKQAVPKATRAVSAARLAAGDARQAAERASIKRDAAKDALDRAEADLRNVEETLALLAPDGAPDATPRLEAALTEARAVVASARAAETEARGRLTDLTRNREQAAARREGLERDLTAWTDRERASAERLAALIQRREETRAAFTAAQDGPSGLTERVAALAAQVEELEAARKSAADALAAAETEQRKAESAARVASQAAAAARECLASSKVKIETSEARLEEIQETAKTQFQRTPEGLLSLAQAGLDDEVLSEIDAAEADRRADYLRRDRDQLGGVNMEAEAEAEELAARLGLQEAEKKDLIGAIAKLREGVDALNSEGRGRLLEAFETVNTHFKALFTTLFRGGQAELRLVDDEDPLKAGLEILAQPPGKRLGALSLMSGGEQALTAAALIFAVFLSNPAPICVLDEVDAPLDDANVDRFCRMLDEMRRRTDTRFVVITHNPVTMSRMDRLFGVTMREKGVSKLVSVDLNAAEELVAAE